MFKVDNIFQVDIVIKLMHLESFNNSIKSNFKQQNLSFTLN